MGRPRCCSRGSASSHHNKRRTSSPAPRTRRPAAVHSAGVAQGGCHEVLSAPLVSLWECCSAIARPWQATKPTSNGCWPSSAAPPPPPSPKGPQLRQDPGACPQLPIARAPVGRHPRALLRAAAVRWTTTTTWRHPLLRWSAPCRWGTAARQLRRTPRLRAVRGGILAWTTLTTGAQGSYRFGPSLDGGREPPLAARARWTHFSP